MKTVRFDEKLAQKYIKEGYWTQETMYGYWEKNAKERPDKEALVDSTGKRLTWAEAKQKIDRIAFALAKDLGLKKDDTLLIQLPNCVEQFLVRVACEKAGVIALTEMITFRHAEVKWLAGQTEAAGAVVLKVYRDFDFYQMMKEVQPELPHLKHIIVAGDDVPADAVSLNKIMEHLYEKEYSIKELKDRRIDPVREVGFLATTTGTTGLPKIIEQTIAARAIRASKPHIENWQLNADDIIVAIAPTAGAPGGTPTYFCAPIVGAKSALLYEWTPENALEFMEKERATVIAVVPTHLARMLQLPVEKYDLSSMRFIRTSGGPLAPALADEAEERFGCPVLSTYGTQDTGSVSGMPITASKEIRRLTVGKPPAGNETKILDELGKEVKRGEVGLLYFRSPSAPAGYYRDLEKTMSEAFDPEGWACPGDLVVEDEDGYLRIVGRQKDIIIRGGQNIYPGEIEGFLTTHPKVSAAAVVAMPDKIMGEKACAFVVLKKKGDKFTFEEMVEYLKTKKIAMYKLPERLEILDTLPVVSESKVDKKLMRKWVADKLKAEGKI
jgi:non-ribosomal peptide synthetase component E (peptide arylation enzyme)